MPEDVPQLFAPNGAMASNVRAYSPNEVILAPSAFQPGSVAEHQVMAQQQLQNQMAQQAMQDQMAQRQAQMAQQQAMQDQMAQQAMQDQRHRRGRPSVPARGARGVLGATIFESVGIGPTPARDARGVLGAEIFASVGIGPAPRLGGGRIPMGQLGQQLPGCGGDVLCSVDPNAGPFGGWQVGQVAPRTPVNLPVNPRAPGGPSTAGPKNEVSVTCEFGPNGPAQPQRSLRISVILPAGCTNFFALQWIAGAGITVYWSVVNPPGTPARIVPRTTSPGEMAQNNLNAAKAAGADAATVAKSEADLKAARAANGDSGPVPDILNTTGNNRYPGGAPFVTSTPPYTNFNDTLGSATPSNALGASRNAGGATSIVIAYAIDLIFTIKIYCIINGAAVQVFEIVVTLHVFRCLAAYSGALGDAGFPNTNTDPATEATVSTATSW